MVAARANKTTGPLLIRKNIFLSLSLEVNYNPIKRDTKDKLKVFREVSGGWNISNGVGTGGLYKKISNSVRDLKHNKSCNKPEGACKNIKFSEGFD